MSADIPNTAPEGVLTPESLTDPKIHGAKAVNLRRMIELGLKVPRFLVLSIDLCERLSVDDELRAKVAAELRSLLPVESYAVRSNSLVEDGSVSSHAGRFSTELDVKPDNLNQAMARVLDARTVLGDRGHAFSLIIQEFFEPEIAGVTFTRDPLGGREMIVESHRGRGEELVSGKIVPLRAVFLWSGTGPKEVPAAAIEAFKRLEGALGHPQDIEWCMSRGEFYFLQTRPITSITADQARGFRYLDETLPKKDEFFYEKTEVSEIAPRPTPLTMDLLEWVHREGGPCAKAYARWGVKLGGLSPLVQIGNELFTDRHAEIRALLPNYDLDAERSFAPEWKWKSGMARAVRNLFSLGLLPMRIAKPKVTTLRSKLESRLKDNTATARLTDELARFDADYSLIFEINLLALASAKQVERLLSGAPVETSEVFASPALFGPLPPAFGWEPGALRGNGLNLTDESSFVQQSPSERVAPAAREWWQALSEMKRKSLQAPIENALELARLREMGRWLTVVRMNGLRDHFLRLARQKGFALERNVFFAKLSEVTRGDLAESECLARKADYDQALRMSLPARIASRIAPPAKAALCISPGIAEGKLVTLEELEREPQGGDLILWTQVLSPEIAAKFPRIKGIVSQSGGLLSHLSILAREAGIPVIANVSLTRELPLGSRVKLDAKNTKLTKAG